MTERVTPWIVRSPVSLNAGPLPVTPVELKVIFGYFAASRKSGDLRWASRWSSCVSIESTSSSTATALGMSVPAGTSIVPVSVLKRPRTFAMTMWRMTNSAAEWAGSIA